MVRLITVASVLALFGAPAIAGAATQVSVQPVQGLDVVVVVDDNGAGDIQTSLGIDAGPPPQAFVAVQSLGGATPGAGCFAATATIVGCNGQFDAIVVSGNGGNDKVTMDLIADGLPPLQGEAFGGPGDDTLKAPPDNRNVPQPLTYIDGEAGNDTITSGNGVDEILGGEGNDTLEAWQGADVVRGGGGDDSVRAGSEEPAVNAADVLDGGPGFDQIPYAGGDYNRGIDDNVSVSLDGLANDGEAGEGDNVIAVEKFRVEAAAAAVVGTEAADDIFVDADSSTIRGLGGNDRLVAYDGHDTIEGGAGDDYLEGGFGNDVLDGGPGVDLFLGDRTERNVIAIGSDQIRARDGLAEQVNCGIGPDTAQVDLSDVVDASCESVDRSGVDGTLAFGAKTRVTLKIVAGRIPASGPLTIRVANANGFAVTGALSGQTTKPVAAARKRRVKLKAKSFSVAANARKTVKLKLPPALRRTLKRTGKLLLRLTAKVEDPAGNTRTVKKRVALKLKRSAAAAGAQTPDPPCPPGVPGAVSIRGYDVEDRGGPLTATHTIRLDTYEGKRLLHHVKFTLPPGATPRGTSFEPAFSADSAGPVPVTATWPHFDDASGSTCTATAQATLQLAAPKPLVFRPPPRDSSRLGVVLSKLGAGRNADRRPVELLLRGVRRGRLPSSRSRAKQVRLSFRTGDTGVDGLSLRVAGWVFEISAQPDEVFVRAEIPFEETSRGRRGYRRGFGWTIELAQAGRRIARLRVVGDCGYSYCRWRFR